MLRPRAPLFLARAVYRRRRLRDAARMLPILGVFLLLLPLLWGTAERAGGRPGVGAGAMGVYIFAIWAMLIGLAAYLAPGLARPETEGETRLDPMLPKPEGEDAV